MGYLHLISAVLAAAMFFSPIMGEGLYPIDLGFAKPYAILAGSTCTSTGAVGTIVTGDIAVYPGTAVSGFPPAILNGATQLANKEAFDAQGSLTAAYNMAAALGFNKTLSSMDLGGMILHPNVYMFAGAAAMNGQLTLDADGDASAVWVFQIASSLLVAEESTIIFKDGIGNPDYVYWQVGSSATIGASVPMIGNIMAFSAITLNNGASLTGRCLARNAAVTLDKNVVTKPNTVSFNVVQTISGISVEQYDANLEVNSATLKEAISETMTGVLSSNILDLFVTAGPTTAAVPTSLRTVVARALATDSITLNYNVVVSSTMTAQELGDQLTASVNDGSFDTYLHAAAAQNGATDLENTSSDTVTTVPITDDGTDDTAAPTDSSSSDSSTLSNGAIIGIAVGGFIGLVLVALIAYYCAIRNSAVVSPK